MTASGGRYRACPWPVPSGVLDVYGPPLLGDADVETHVDSDTAGTAEAFLTTAGYSGQVSSVHVYVDASSTASRIVVGIYADRNGTPGALQQQATITGLRAGSWNYIDVPLDTSRGRAPILDGAAWT